MPADIQASLERIDADEAPVLAPGPQRQHQEVWANRRFSAEEIAHATTLVERVGDSLAVLEQRA